MKQFKLADRNLSSVSLDNFLSWCKLKERQFAKLRSERNFSQEQVALKIKEPVSAVIAVETNYKKARRLTVLMLCSLYELSLEKEAHYSDNINYVAILSRELSLIRHQKMQNRFIKHRLKTKLTKQEIAKGAGISLGKLNKIETDIIDVAILYIDKLRKFYGMKE